MIDGAMLGVGAILRDHKGKMLVADTKQISVAWSAKMAEATTTRYDFQLA